jgi:hypothetical protein
MGRNVDLRRDLPGNSFDDRLRRPRPRNSSRWIDLIAFLAVLALGGALIAVVSTTAVSVATICVALGGLYRLWKRSPASEDDRRPSELTDREDRPTR